LLRRRLGNRRTRAEAADADVTLLAEMTLLGLNAGLTFPQALESAAAHVARPLADEVRQVLRRASRTGPATALAAREGRAGDLYGIAARAAITGAPIAGGVQSLVDDRRAAERAASLAAARRLPVRLLFPLALLILPGFMVLTVGPAILSALSRLST
jgi:tight adherence protein C